MKPIICEFCGLELLPYEDYYAFVPFETIICRECLLDWAHQYMRTVGED